jgi:hypothetical protein
MSYAGLFTCVLLLAGGLRAQEGSVKGRVFDPLNQPVPGVRIVVEGTGVQTLSDAGGEFRLTLSAGRSYLIRFSHVAYQAAQREVAVAPGRVHDLPVKLLELEAKTVEIIGEEKATSIRERSAMLVSPIRLDKAVEIPVVAPSVEALVKSMPGVASNNEFSSQYQVRGGNFDENLVYVNGIEIYRPFLVRSGQQEGLGFSNPSLAQSLQFSTGGFGAVYGDRLSSVLDISYRQPRDFRATAELGIVTTNLHLEGISKNRKQPDQPGRFTWLMGARRFALSYFLNSLNTQGQYQPLFLDYQALFTFTPSRRSYPERYRSRRNGEADTLFFPNDRWKFSLLFTASRNTYEFEPVGQVSTIGTLVGEVFRIRTGFEGREISGYTTGQGAWMAEFRPSTRLRFNAILSAFRTEETELIDVEGGYLIGEVNTNLGSSEFNETEFDLGIGSIYRHARNYLQGTVAAAEVNGKWSSDNQVTHQLSFGARYQRQWFEDYLKEYALLDSAGYVVDSTGSFGLDEFIRGSADLQSSFYKAYLQHDWQLGKRVLLSYGARVLYYDLIRQWMFSPRGQLLLRLLEGEDGEARLRLRLAAGVYHQPPFYREFRRFDGSLNINVLPQRSTHFILGAEYRFEAWGRPFLLFSEAYYKQLYNLIPYETENVRIRYYPDLSARGYAWGADLRLNGQFINGIDSWVSIGLLKTSEDVLGDTLGFVPRPSDQRLTFAMYFQDELPTNPTYKVHVNYVYGSGMRFGPPRNFPLRTFFQFPPYHRVDIGFSKIIPLRKRLFGSARGIESLWITAEIYNLLQRQNAVAFVWIKDLQNQRFAVPNYLSARLLNVRLVMRFK